MHPIIRVLCFLCLIATLVRANFPYLLLADGLFLVFALRNSDDIFTFSWRLIRRMRWLWLSIILLYTLMTPGGGHSLIIGNIELSLGGFWLGCERCLALLTVLLYFALLIHTTTTHQLQGALYCLLQPLRWLGLPASRLSIRIALTMQMIHELQSRWAASPEPKKSVKSWRDIPERIEKLIHEVFTQAESKPAQTELTMDTSLPGYRQWLILIGLILIIVTLRILSVRYL